MKFLLVFFLSLLSVFAVNAQTDQGSGTPPPRNLKLIEEYSDGKGNLVRTVQYDQGMMRITETIIMPKPRPVGFMAPVMLDTLRSEYLNIVVLKSQYRVNVYYRKKLIRSYKAVFGPRPKQDKCMEGDRCTPEGWFKIASKNPGSKYTKFMGISYPSDSSRMKFNKLKADGVIPSTATIGGNVGIHGIWPGGDDMIEMGVGWTDGCIALKNKDIEELYSYVGVGTKVVISK